eukprot:212792-Rhodomonas_salina.2
MSLIPPRPPLLCDARYWATRAAVRDVRYWPRVCRYTCSLHCEIKFKKTQSPYTLSQECAFLCLISGCTRCPGQTIALYVGVCDAMLCVVLILGMLLTTRPELFSKAGEALLWLLVAFPIIPTLLLRRVRY